MRSKRITTPYSREISVAEYSNGSGALMVKDTAFGHVIPSALTVENMQELKKFFREDKPNPIDGINLDENHVITFDYGIDGRIDIQSCYDGDIYLRGFVKSYKSPVISGYIGIDKVRALHKFLGAHIFQMKHGSRIRELEEKITTEKGCIEDHRERIKSLESDLAEAQAS